MLNLTYEFLATPDGISCYTPSNTGPLTPQEASSPLISLNIYVATSPPPSFSYQSSRGSLCLFGDLAPTLPSPSSIDRMSGSYHKLTSPLTSLSESPNPSISALNKAEERLFASKNHALYSDKSTSEGHDHDVLQDDAMKGILNEGDRLAESDTTESINSNKALSPSVTSIPLPPRFLESEPLSEGLAREDDVPGIAGGFNADHTAMSFLETPTPILTPVFVDDDLIINRIDQYKAAEQMHSQTLELDKCLGLEHLDMLGSLCYRDIEQTAAELYLCALRCSEDNLLFDRLDTLNSVNDLATMFQNQGRCEVAEEVHRRVVDRRAKVLWEEHRDMLPSLCNLVLVLYLQGSYKAAEEMCRWVLEGQENVLGKDHLDTLTSVNNLALILCSQGNYKEAEQMHQQVLKAQESRLGPQHPNTLSSASNLALVLERQGKYKAAKEMIRRVLDARERELGPEHPSTLTSISNLAWVLESQGRYKAAEKMNRRALGASEKVLGPEHPETLTIVSNLASVLESQGKYEATEDMNRRVLNGRNKVLGPGHPDTLTSSSNLALVLERQGKYEEAEEMARRALCGHEKVLGHEHPDTLTSVSNLALVLEGQGKYEAAKVMNRRALRGSEKVLGPEHPDTLISARNLASLLKRQRKDDVAEEMNPQPSDRSNIVLDMLGVFPPSWYEILLDA